MLAHRGHEVILNYVRSNDAAAALAGEIRERGGRASTCRFDVAHAAETSDAIERLLAEGSPIGILVNNAGVVDDSSFPVMSSDSWRNVTRTTLDGFFNVTQPLVMPMVRARWGRIINISSISGVVGNRGQVNYSAAKAGLNGATKALALEVARRGVTVNSVAPGMIETDMTAEVPDAFKKSIPMRRFGSAEEVAHLVAFLASGDAGYITGQVIGINGGLG